MEKCFQFHGIVPVVALMSVPNRHAIKYLDILIALFFIKLNFKIKYS